jgi:hypothetical protein
MDSNWNHSRRRWSTIPLHNHRSQLQAQRPHSTSQKGKACTQQMSHRQKRTIPQNTPRSQLQAQRPHSTSQKGKACTQQMSRRQQRTTPQNTPRSQLQAQRLYSTSQQGKASICQKWYHFDKQMEMDVDPVTALGILDR